MSPNADVTLRLLKGEPQEMAELQQVLERAPAYFELATGGPPGPAEAQSTYSALPPGKTYADKFVFGVYRGDRMVGCVDLIRAYPDAHTAHVGLLLIAEPFHRKGVGTAAYRAVEDYVRAWNACDRMRIGVVGTNDRVISFWSKLGFAPTGEVKPYRYAHVVSETAVLVKPLDAT